MFLGPITGTIWRLTRAGSPLSGAPRLGSQRCALGLQFGQRPGSPMFDTRKSVQSGGVAACLDMVHRTPTTTRLADLELAETDLATAC